MICGAVPAAGCGHDDRQPYRRYPLGPWRRHPGPRPRPTTGSLTVSGHGQRAPRCGAWPERPPTSSKNSGPPTPSWRPRSLSCPTRSNTSGGRNDPLTQRPVAATGCFLSQPVRCVLACWFAMARAGVEAEGHPQSRPPMCRTGGRGASCPSREISSLRGEMALPELSPVQCECPCHDLIHPLDVRHLVPCCCPHRFVVRDDCSRCRTVPGTGAIVSKGKFR